MSKKRKRGSRRHRGRSSSGGEGQNQPHLCASTAVSIPAPPPSVPQVGLRKSDSYLMTLSPASPSEQPIVTGGLKGTEAKVQVIDLWPQRSASGAEGVVLSQWEPRGTPQQWGQAAQHGFHVCILPDQAHTHASIQPCLKLVPGRCLSIVSWCLDLGVPESMKAGTWIRLLTITPPPRQRLGSPCALK